MLNFTCHGTSDWSLGYGIFRVTVFAYARIRIKIMIQREKRDSIILHYRGD